MNFTYFLSIFKEIISFISPLINTFLLFYIALMLNKIYNVINKK